MKSLRIGTRKSPLALWQANFIKDQLFKSYPALECLLVEIESKADLMLNTALHKIGDKGLFTKELDKALLDNQIDISVNSLKDIPTNFHNNLMLSVVTKRATASDALVSQHNIHTLDDLPPKAIVATGSLRRRSQLLNYRPDLNVIGIRGNIKTRYHKFYSEKYDAMLLAYIGIERMGLTNTVRQKIPYEIMLPAVGQGGLGILCRRDDQEVQSIIHKCHDIPSYQIALAERSFLRKLEGGCSKPITAYGFYENGEIALHAFVGTVDGIYTLKDKVQGNHNHASELGIQLATKMIDKGANDLLNNKDTIITA